MQDSTRAAIAAHLDQMATHNPQDPGFAEGWHAAVCGARVRLLPDDFDPDPTTDGYDSRPVVLIIRDPDSSTWVDAWPGDGMPLIVEVDRGSTFDATTDDVDTFTDFAAGVLSQWEEVPEDHTARDAIHGAILAAWSGEGDPPAFLPHDRIREAANAATDAFWSTVAEHFPGVPGDMAPGEVDGFVTAAHAVVKTWTDGKAL